MALDNDEGTAAMDSDRFNNGASCSPPDSTKGVSLGEMQIDDRVRESNPLSPSEQLYEDFMHRDWDEDEDEDEDWKPDTIEAQTLWKWFCVNCTMPNLDENTHCRLCGEHRDSGILKQGHFAPALYPVGNTENDAKPVKRVMVNRTAVGYDERMLLHCDEQPKPHPHPERPDRLRAILSGLTAAGLYPEGCVTIPAREITRAELETVHTHDHVDLVEASSSFESSYFTQDTYANPHSALAARLAAGICADLASAILTAQVDNGFAVVRPPGHHAESVKSMGFCLHNNACIAAKAAQAAGAKKVLIIDWDVHHGNGTQEIFERDPSVLYISVHRHEGGAFYPGTGAADEVGRGPGEGFSVNIPWPCAGIGDNDYVVAFEHIVLPIAKQFEPEITIISAGFDAADGDPLGGCKVTPAGYAQMTHMLTSVSGGKLLVVLEGGYNLRSISASATAVFKVLRGEEPETMKDPQPSEAALAAIMDVFDIQTRYWSALSFLRFTSQHMQFKVKERSKKRKRRVLKGPIWWTWGRRIWVYKHWFGVRRSHIR